MLLTRYTIDGVIWGINYLWLDAEGRLAMFATGGGGGLSFKTVRAALLPLRDELMDVATRAQMAELSSIASKQRAGRRRHLALVGATLVDATGAPAIPNATVVVQEGPHRRRRAEREHAGSAGRAPRSTSRARRSFPASGTTTRICTRSSGFRRTSPPASRRCATWARSGRCSSRCGTRFVLARSPVPTCSSPGLIDGPGPQGFGEFSAATPDEGRAIVRRYHEMGFEMIKIYLALAPDVTAAICDEAHKQGMTCTGHVPTSMDLHAAIDSGMDQIAHFPVRGDLTTEEGKKQLAHFVAKKTIFDPTASWGEIGGKSAQEPMENIQPVLQHLPAPLLQNRVASLGQSPSDTATSHARLARMLANIKAAHDAGVPLITGTDEGIPAYSVYREMELYVKAGFTPMDALRAATAVAAQAMRVENGRRHDRAGQARRSPRARRESAREHLEHPHRAIRDEGRQDVRERGPLDSGWLQAVNRTGRAAGQKDEGGGRERFGLAALIAFAACDRQSVDGAERVRPNDNRVAAGALHDGVLTLHLEARRGLWYPDEDDGPGLVMEMFAEAGHAPQNPGPLIRVTAGTRIEVTVRNALRDSTLIVYGLHTRPSAVDDTIQIAAGATRALSFVAGAPGTYFYWGTTTHNAVVDRSGIDSQLHGAFVVDPEVASPLPIASLCLVPGQVLQTAQASIRSSESSTASRGLTPSSSRMTLATRSVGAG